MAPRPRPPIRPASPCASCAPLPATPSGRTSGRFRARALGWTAACGLALLHAPLAPLAPLAAQEAAPAPTASADEDAVVATASADEDAVVATVQALLAAINDGDGEALGRILHPDGRFFSTMSGPGGDAGPARKPMSTADFASAVTGPGPALMERMWDPTVRVHGSVAQLWAPYDFYRDGAFSHCGVDAFHLVKEAGAWRIVGGVWTVDRPPSCSLHPDGPPGGTKRDSG